MSLRPLAFAGLLVVAGCGSLVPYSLAPSWLAPDVVPEPDASQIVVLDQATAAQGIVTGRVLDVTTGRPLADAVVTTHDATSEADASGRFEIALGDDRQIRAEAPGYLAVEGVIAKESASVLVLLRAEALVSAAE